MREAFSGQYGGPSAMNPEVERLQNLRRAIDSIEDRINGQSGNEGHSSGEIAQLQAQLNRLAGQVNTGPLNPANVGFASQPVGFEAATADIMRRQGELLQQNDPSSIARAAAAQQQASMEAIAQQFATLKVELAGLKDEVAKPVAVQHEIAEKEVKRIAQQLSGLQSTPKFDEQSFNLLTKELADLRGSMKQDLKKELASTRNISSRLDTLSHGISDLAGGINSVTHGLDGMSTQSANLVAPKVDNLSAQLDTMRTTIDDLPQTLSITRFEDRLKEMASKIDAIPTTLPSSKTDLSSLEGRLDEIARALVAVSSIGNRTPELDLSPIERLEARFKTLNKSIEAITAQPSAIADQELKALSTRIEGLTERLGSFEKYAQTGDLGGASAMFAAPDMGMIEKQLSQLTQRLDEAVSDNSTNAQISNLEAQIGKILRQITDGSAKQSVDFTPVESRLGQIESKLDFNQKNSVEAAQQAAMQAVQMLGPQSDSGQVIAALSNDLKSLQDVAENGSAMNQQSIADMHILLTQVVDRLGSIENNISENAQIAVNPANMPRAATFDPEPQIAVAAENTVQAADVLVNSVQATQPPSFETAPAQPQASYTITHGNDAPIDTHIMNAPSIDPVAAMNASMEQPAPVSGYENHLPLEPGISGAPDLNRMVEEASAQLVQAKASLASGDASYGSGADNIRPDPVGAARRALQATTDEMNAVREEVAIEEKNGNSSGTGFLSKFSGGSLRKPIVVAAAATLLFVLATFGYKKFIGGQDINIAAVNAPAIEQSVGQTDEVVVGNNVSGFEKPENAVVVEKAMDDNSARSVDPVIATAPKDDGQMIQGDDAGPAIVEAPVVKVPESNVQVAELPKAAVPESVNPVDAVTKQESVDSSTSQTVPVVATYDVPANIGPIALINAASAGNAKALFEVGMRYSDGKSVKRDMVESAKWFERAAETGYAPAQYSIGSLYEKGIGVAKDTKTAAIWYEKASVQGNARAMHNLAVIYTSGEDGPADMDSAVRWFQKAADFGIKDSQFNLGILYGKGMGVSQNLADSYKWFALAAKAGDQDAVGMRDEVANSMDPQELDGARRNVSDWKPAILNDATNKVSVPQEWRDGASVELSGEKGLVFKAQASLNERGFNVGKPDGLMGPKTQKAIMEFQRGAGLPVNGKVNKKLLMALGV